ncbi:MAG: DUF5106 domain-containing protein [Flavobacteriales bacterium]
MRSLLTLLIALSAFGAHAQNERRLEFQLNGAPQRKVYLANYYGNRLYYTDSAVTDAQGKAVFARATGYKPGVYGLLLGNKRLEVVVTEPLVRMSTDAADPEAKATVLESRENQLFRSYKALMASGAPADSIMAQALRMAAANPGTLAAQIIQLGRVTDRRPVLSANGAVDSVATMERLRTHFWDGVDLKDERLFGVPAFQNKLEEYVALAMPLDAAAINTHVDALIERTANTPDMRKFMVNWITTKYESSQVDGMDGVYVHMAQKHVCSRPDGTLDAMWTPAEKWKKVCERAKKKQPLQIGETAMQLTLVDTTAKNWVNMQQLPEPCVVVVFWSPHCSHCKQALPVLHKEWKEQLKPLGVGIYAVAEAQDSAHFTDWKAFVKANQLEWTNVGAAWPVHRAWKRNPAAFVPKLTNTESMRYQESWEVFNTPVYYIVDKERRIAGRPKTLKDLFAIAKEVAQRK